MPSNIFQANKNIPFHVAVGAVLTDKDGKICCHFFNKGELDQEPEGISDLYLLMRETLHAGESLSDAIERGLLEEFGAKGEIGHFLGAINAWFPGVTTGIKIYKTTLYFFVHLIELDVNLREQGAAESRSELRWMEPEALITLFREQGAKYDRTDLDESDIIENYLQYIHGK